MNDQLRRKDSNWHLVSLQSMASNSSKERFNRRSKNFFVQSLVLPWLVYGPQMATASCSFYPNASIDCCDVLEQEDRSKIARFGTGRRNELSYFGTDTKEFFSFHFPISATHIIIDQKTPFTISREAFSDESHFISLTFIGLDFDMQTFFSPLDRPRSTVHYLNIQRFTEGKRGRLFLHDPFLQPLGMKLIRNMELPNNLIASVSERFLRDADRLLYFDLSNNLITKIPDCFKTFVPKAINLAHNQIEKVMDNEIRHAGCPLLKIDLSFNDLHTLRPEALNKQCKLEEIKLSENFQFKCLDDLTFSSNLNELDVDVSYTLIDELSFLQPVDKITLSMWDTSLVCDCQVERLVKKEENTIRGTCMWDGNVMDLQSPKLRKKWDSEGCDSVQSSRQCRSSANEENTTDDNPEKPNRVTNILRLSPTHVTVITSTLVFITLLIFGLACFLDLGDCLMANPEEFDQSEDSESQETL